MEKVRLLNEANDYKKIGVKPDKVEIWEDGRRTKDDANEYEWWYFDAILDDGTKVVVNFNSHMDHEMKSIVTSNVKDDSLKGDGEFRFLRVRITMPDGKTNHESFFVFNNTQTQFSKSKCDVRFNMNCFSGDLNEYHIKVNPVNGIGVDLVLQSTSKPWRPGAGYFVFGDKEEKYFTWLCAVPKGNVIGTITVNGEEHAVKGHGYHDHQWGNVDHITLWNNWLWARQDFRDYNLLIFDYVTSKKYGMKKFPLMFLEDKDGNILFENSNAEYVQADVLEEYIQKGTNKHYPKVMKYKFEVDDKILEYILTAEAEIEVTDVYLTSPPQKRAQYDSVNLHPSYTRYSAVGKIKFTNDEQCVEQSGDLIYEFVYLGKDYKL